MEKTGTIKNSKYSAVIYVIMAGFFFALMNLFIRLSGDVPTFEKCFFRNFVAGIIALLSVIRGEKFVLGEKKNILYIFIRALSGTIALIFNFYAVDHMVIADASMLNKLSPFFALVFSYFVLKEKVSKRQIICLLIAFVGVLCILKPTPEHLLQIPALLGFFSGMGAGLAYTFLRKARLHGASGPLIIFAFSAFSCITSAVLMIPDFVMPTGRQFVFLILTGFAAAGGQFSITAAYGRAPARELAVYEYNQIIFAALMGLFVLSEFPDLLSVIGYGIIIAASYLMYKKHGQ